MPPKVRKPTSSAGRQDGGYEPPILAEPKGGPIPGGPTHGEVQRAADNQLKQYWLHGEGAGKWSTWTELYNHLKKHLPAESAKRVAAQWFHDRYGIWPGHQAGDNPAGPG